MNKTLRSFVMAVMLIITPLSRVIRGQQLADDKQQTSRIKFDITKRLRNDRSHVVIRLRNGLELSGRITQTSETMFTLKEDKNRSIRDISYSDVAKIKGHGLSKGAKFGILTAIIAGSVVIGALVGLKSFDPFEHGVLR